MTELNNENANTIKLKLCGLKENNKIKMILNAKMKIRKIKMVKKKILVLNWNIFIHSRATHSAIDSFSSVQFSRSVVSDSL